ncbi:helix-turn-helix transcriptional regulator [Mesorhizobium sp. AR07]|uniref:helix-turn-helix transcriptional regulator n=1 Tax=Mesorhizobium sp. AR07 TaxID=2865838 RepID=UPI002160FC3D|nr:helix-turn-helix transcriptional regulator [Mesorhizobium sp. AR07]UVK44455.1 helix-turn-helix transcriptional regulator [Mesorhizobium sp. AR07]
MSIHYFTTPKGDEMAVLPRAELNALQDRAARAREVASYRAGEAPGFTAEEALAFANAVSPLAFWRARKGRTQAALASEVGISQNMLSAVENGKRGGDVGLWLRLSRALDVPVDQLVDED